MDPTVSFILYELFFWYELIHVLEIVCLSQDSFLVLPFLPITFLGRSLQLLFIVGPFLTPMNIYFDTIYNDLIDTFNAFFSF